MVTAASASAQPTMNELEKCSKEELIQKVLQLQSHMKPSKSQPKPQHKNNLLDFSKYAARRIALKFSYIGWNYHGLTSQEKDTVETIESHLFKALMTAKLIPPEEQDGRKRCLMSRCGRTDKGVSSLGQVAGLLVRSTLPKGAPGTYEWPSVEQVDEAKTAQESRHLPHPCEPRNIESDEFPQELPYLTMLNRLLPPDIRVIAWSPVDHDFDARFSCTHRLYNYFFPKANLDIDRMNQAAQKLIGTHDFRHFCKIDHRNYQSVFTRRILDAKIVPLHNESDAPPLSNQLVFKEQTSFYVFVVKGNAFLWHQVRCMMAVLFLIGQGLEPVSLIEDLLDLSKHPDGSGRPIYTIASELPLILVECGYESVTFDWHYEDVSSTSLPVSRQSCLDPTPTCSLKAGPQDLVQQKLVQRIWEMYQEHQTRGILLHKFLSFFTQEEKLANLTYAIDTSYFKGNNMKQQSYLPIMQRRRCEAAKADARQGKRKGMDSPLSDKSITKKSAK